MIGEHLVRLEQLRDRYLHRSINRRSSELVARGAPWGSVMLGSFLPAVLWVASAPILPSFGLLVLIAWRQMRPGLLPVWAGLPLGAFDDLYSGQPFGCGVLLWSLVMLVLEAIEARFPWRGFRLEWLFAAILIAATLLLGVAIANMAGGATPISVVAPQVVISILCYPLVARLVAALDRFRLIPFIDVGEWG